MSVVFEVNACKIFQETKNAISFSANTIYIKQYFSLKN